MSMQVDGVSVITGGLDYWYRSDADLEPDLSEFRVRDWRLERKLETSEFRLPPDWKDPYGPEAGANAGLKVPVLRFPQYSFCMYCKALKQSPLSQSKKPTCDDPSHKDWDRPPQLVQVPFIAICDEGHLSDVPFNEWVHRTLTPSCSGPLRLVSRGAGLDGQVVTCGYDSKGELVSKCGKERSLYGITQASRKGAGLGTILSDNLTKQGEYGAPYECPGLMPWLGNHREPCGQGVSAALRGGGNVYFPKVESSIFVPQKAGSVTGETREYLKAVGMSSAINAFDMRASYEEGANTRDIFEAMISKLHPEAFNRFSVDELWEAYLESRGIGAGADAYSADDFQLEDLAGWRYPEYQQIRETPVDDYLKATDSGLPDGFGGLIGRVRAVETLRETRVLRGFTRLRDTYLELDRGKKMLRLPKTSGPRDDDWLPAYVVKGEGIFLELDQARLKDWEQRDSVRARAHLAQGFYDRAAKERGWPNRELSPRFLLLHTFAHLLINQLVFDCGYSSSSLRERLYANDELDKEMLGVLVYTAAGDSEGTLGGLVRMSKPDELGPVIERALEHGRWCSTDPVCMEISSRGQGPDSCNLAACYGCSLLPETSCEEFNRFLDRALVIGTFEDPSVGYFSGV